METDNSHDKRISSSPDPRSSRNRDSTKIFEMSTLKRISKVVGAIYVAVCALLWGIQGIFIFHPVSSDYAVRNTVTEYEVVVDESKGITSRGYVVNPTSPGPVV